MNTLTCFALIFSWFTVFFLGILCAKKRNGKSVYWYNAPVGKYTVINHSILGEALVQVYLVPVQSRGEPFWVSLPNFKGSHDYYNQIKVGHFVVVTVEKKGLLPTFHFYDEKNNNTFNVTDESPVFHAII